MTNHKEILRLHSSGIKTNYTRIAENYGYKRSPIIAPFESTARQAPFLETCGILASAKTNCDL